MKTEGNTALSHEVLYLQTGDKDIVPEKAAKLWGRDFSLLVIGQTVSIFGNMILSFALPLYILYISNSPALFGFVLGISNIPLFLMSPIGGIIADRFRKQRIMFWLDTITTAIIVAYIIASGFLIAVVPIVIVKLMALNSIQAVYMSSVQAAIPSLVPKGKIVTANSVAQLVNSFSNMAGMAVAGVLFAGFGLMPILVVSAVCFAITAVMDLFIRIPYKKQESTGGMIKIVKSDVSMAARFMFRERPIIARAALIGFMFSLTLMSMIIVGVPVLITQHLGMSMDYVGISQSIMLGGGLVGGIFAGVFGSKLKFENAYLILTAAGLMIVPIGIALLVGMPAFSAYLVITIAGALTTALIMPANILIISYVQAETPVELIGKVMSLIVVIPFIGNALGQLLYGVVFEWLYTIPWAAVFATVVLTLLAGLYTRVYFKE